MKAIFTVAAAAFFLSVSLSSFAQACPQPGTEDWKWGLWKGAGCLRGANVWQALVSQKRDGMSRGAGHVGPPFGDSDFEALRALGASYVQLSVPGLFTETPPYLPDEKVARHLDRLLARIERAGLYAVIGFRTGPGRNESGFDASERERALNSVWTDEEAQRAWEAMWRFTAERYKNSSVVVGYELLVEPNANAAVLDVDDPEAFYPRYEGTLKDWNPMAVRLTDAVRGVDMKVPLLIGAMNYNDIRWLPYLKQTGDPRSVLVLHQYQPHLYTHQKKERSFSYPGTIPGDEGNEIQIDKQWLRALLEPARQLASDRGVPVAVTEWGASRGAPGAAEYIRDSLSLFDEFGWSHAVWMWEPVSHSDENNIFDFRNTAPIVFELSSSWKKSSVTHERNTGVRSEGLPGPVRADLVCRSKENNLHAFGIGGAAGTLTVLAGQHRAYPDGFTLDTEGLLPKAARRGNDGVEVVYRDGKGALPAIRPPSPSTAKLALLEKAIFQPGAPGRVFLWLKDKKTPLEFTGCRYLGEGAAKWDALWP